MTATDRLREVLRQHGYDGAVVDAPHYRRVEFCTCGWRSTLAEKTHVDHVAAEVLSFLQLRTEWTAGLDDWCGDEGGFDLDSDIYEDRADAEEAVKHWQENGWEGDRSFVVQRLVGPWVRADRSDNSEHQGGDA